MEKSVIEEGEILAQMQKVRQEHAKNQKHDYSHVFRKKTRLELIRLSCIIPGIEFAYAAETAFVSPLLLEIGIQHNFMTLIWGISPILGFFLAPLIASLSDRCTSILGRRRPFILALGVGVIIGLLIVPHGKSMGMFLGDEYDDFGLINSPVSWAVLITIFGVVLLDFDTENCQTLSRAYFLDVCLPEDHAKILSTSTIIGGLGGSLGYIIGAIDWNETAVGMALGGNVNTVFTIVIITFCVGFLITLTSFREIPWPLMKKDLLLRPITHDVISDEKGRMNGTFFIKPPSNKDQEDIEVAVHEAEKPMFAIEYLKNIIFMPYSMKILSLTNLFSWMSYLSFCLYFTDFVGEAVFHGDPTGTEGSDELLRFQEGVRFGCWGLAIFAFSCSLYSTVIEFLIKVFKGRTVYVGGLLTFSIGMCILATFPEKITVLTLTLTAGVMYATLYTLPFLLVAQYHAKGSFKMKDGNYVQSTQNRGLGTDIGIMGSMLFLAQLMLSLGMGSFITLLGSTKAVIYSASIFSFLAALSATQVVYMDL